MNCKGCGHFSPLASEWFANLEEYSRDLEQVNKLLTIREIRLMGGEPLLHPNIESFLLFTRSCLPKSDIRLVTNGILLHEMSDSFWKTCKSCSVTIEVTVYPPMVEKEEDLVELAESMNVRIYTQRAISFHAFYNSKGSSDPEDNFRRCRSRWNAPILRDGKIYGCNIPAYIHYFNARFGTDVPSGGFVDIYSPKLDGWDIIRALNERSPTCRFCTLGWKSIPVFPWSTSKHVLAEWDSKSCKNVDPD